MNIFFGILTVFVLITCTRFSFFANLHCAIIRIIYVDNAMLMSFLPDEMKISISVSSIKSV